MGLFWGKAFKTINFLYVVCVIHHVATARVSLIVVHSIASFASVDY